VEPASIGQPALQVLIETGYNRTSYGTPTPFQILIPLNQAKVLSLPVDLANAIVQGIQDTIGDVNGTRKVDQNPLDPPSAAATPTLTPTTNPVIKAISGVLTGIYNTIRSAGGHGRGK
jgi:hypothetical protein